MANLNLLVRAELVITECMEEMEETVERFSVKPRLDSSNDKMEWTESDGSVRYLKRERE